MNEALQSFLKVSQEYPANGLAQSIALALKVQKKPTLLKEFQDLPYDYHTWEAIRKASQFPHQRAREKPGRPSRVPEQLTDEKIVGVLNGEATLIALFVGHPREILENIADIGKTTRNMNDYARLIEQRLGISLPRMNFE